MGFDFNQASTEQTLGFDVIPPKSCVIVRMHVRKPYECNKPAGSDPEWLCLSPKGMEYLSTELEVVEGKFAGRKIYHCFNVGCQKQMTDGQRKSLTIAMAQLRAIIEISKGIHPEDNSDAACRARMMEIPDLEGMTFPALIDCERSTSLSKDGSHYYTNNVMKKVITQKDPEYAQIQQSREIISDIEVPYYPAGGAQTPMPGWAGGNNNTWGNANTAKAPTQNAWGSTPSQAPSNKPAQAARPDWAQGQPLPPPPSEQQLVTGGDHVPFS